MLLNVTAEVGGIGSVNALVDSGCTYCQISRDLLTDLIKSKIAPGAFKTATLSDGSEMDLLGYVDLLVSYLGKAVEVPFYVANTSCSPIVLGANWIRKSGAILKSDGRKLGVTFGGKEEFKGCRTDACASPFVPVDVDEIGLVSALVDTGALSSSVRRDMLTSTQQSKSTSTPRRSIIGNGTEITSLEQVSLNITFQGVTTNIKNVDIESTMDDELVLGMDWINQTRAVIQSNGSEIIVSLPKKKKSQRLIAYLSQQWNSTFGSISRMSSLVSNLM